jgi:hypothetical protein
MMNQIDFNEKASVERLSVLLSNEQLGRMKADQDKKDQFYKIVAEKMARPITPNDYVDDLCGEKFSMMARGHILEKKAIAKFTEVTGIKTDCKEVVWIRDDNQDSYVSPDAPITDDNGVIVANVEAKCPDSHVMIRAYDEGRYPEEYQEQILKHFIVNKDQQIQYLIMYTDVIPSLEYLLFEVHRKDVVDTIEIYESFENEILKQVNELAGRLAF